MHHCSTLKPGDCIMHPCTAGTGRTYVNDCSVPYADPLSMEYSRAALIVGIVPGQGHTTK